MRLPAARLVSRVVPSGLPVARAILRSGLARVFGPPPFDPAAHPGDPGLFGPESPSWRVLGDHASIVGGVRALLVQLAHPVAAAGVVGHSRYRDDPLGRLQQTAAYVVTTTFGALPEVLAIAGVVRRAHEKVRGRTPDGTMYRADDPHLLTWVSIALTSSFLAADRVYAVQPVDAAAADRFVEEQSRGAALLDPRVDLERLRRDPGAQRARRDGEFPLPLLERLPGNVAQLEGVLRDYDDELALDDAGRRALHFLLWPPLPAAVRAGYVPLLAGAVATLEPRYRRLLGLRLPPGAGGILSLQTDTLLAALRVVGGTGPSVRAAAARVAKAG